MKRPNRVPLWLRRLDQVKAELKGVRFPRTTEEGFRQCAELSAAALYLLREEVRESHPGASAVEESIKRYDLQTYGLRDLLVLLSGGLAQ